MELKIVGNPIALCKVNMKGFKADFKQTLNIEDSIKKNFAIIDKGKFEDTALFKWVYYGLNWGKIIDAINNVDDEVMEIRFFRCKYKNKVELAPGLISEDRRHFTFKQEAKDGIDVFMVNSFMKNPNFDISCYLNATTYNYGLVRWRSIIDFDN